jgi:hypothetical protein
MQSKPTSKFNTASALNILAGVIFVAAAFHPLTGEAGVDYAYIFIGLVFIIVGIAGMVKKSK